MKINMNLNLISIILYICGIAGIFIFFLFVLLALKKKTKASSVLSVIMLILSILLLGSGTTLKIIYNKKNPQPVASNTVTEQNTNASGTNSSDNEEKKPSIDDLKFNYTLSAYDNNNKTANMTIQNNSNSVFNGQVKVKFLNSSKQLVDSLNLQIKNLIPNKTYSPDAFVNGNVDSIEYSFSGNFSEENIDQIPYSISKVSAGNKFIRINVTVNDVSKNHLEQICNELAYENSNTHCNGLLVYFYPQNSSNELDFDKLIADYYLNNVNKNSKFTYYK